MGLFLSYLIIFSHLLPKMGYKKVGYTFGGHTNYGHTYGAYGIWYAIIYLRSAWNESKQNPLTQRKSFNPTQNDGGTGREIKPTHIVQ